MYIGESFKFMPFNIKLIKTYSMEILKPLKQKNFTYQAVHCNFIYSSPKVGTT